MIDIKISSGGDFVLSPPEVDINGNIVYNSDGQTINDLAFVSDASHVKQCIIDRLMTETGDWYVFSKIGQSLNDLIGLPNNATTAILGQDIIIGALTYGDLLASDSISIVYTPVNKTEIVYYVSITLNYNTSFSIYITLGLERGVILDVN